MNPIDAYRAIQSTNPIQPLERPDRTQETTETGQNSFQSVLGNLVREVAGLQQDADRSIEGLVTGETTNIHDVTTRMTEAGIAFDLMMEVRNKLMDAYQQIMRMQA
jgi:flagellar hook-basal body complex protein FliE